MQLKLISMYYSIWYSTRHALTKTRRKLQLYLNEIVHLKISFLHSTRSLMHNNSVSLHWQQTNIIILICLPLLLDKGRSILRPVLWTRASFLEDSAHYK